MPVVAASMREAISITTTQVALGSAGAPGTLTTGFTNWNDAWVNTIRTGAVTAGQEYRRYVQLWSPQSRYLEAMLAAQVVQANYNRIVIAAVSDVICRVLWASQQNGFSAAVLVNWNASIGLF